MTKEQAVEQLKALGYDAFTGGFEVMIRVDHSLSRKEHKELEKVIEKIGFTSSWGWVVKKNAD